MNFKKFLESTDFGDWEPEDEQAPTVTVWLQPTDETDGWTGWTGMAWLFDTAFGSTFPLGWSVNDIPKVGSFIRLAITLQNSAQAHKGFALLKKHGIKMSFMESQDTPAAGAEAMPRIIRMGDGYYLEKKKPEEMVRVNSEPAAPLNQRKVVYLVKRLLDDGDRGTISAELSPYGDTHWKSVVDGQSEIFPPEVFRKFDAVKKADLFNPLKFKWWAQNRLIAAGLLPLETNTGEVLEANKMIPAKHVGASGLQASLHPTSDNNFGFEPERKQFWFKIDDEDLFFDRQAEEDYTSPNRVSNGYVQQLFDTVLLKYKPGQENASFAAMVLKLGALMGNNSVDTPMVVMIDTAKAVPNIHKMKEYGLKPVFLESRDAN